MVTVTVATSLLLLEEPPLPPCLFCLHLKSLISTALSTFLTKFLLGNGSVEPNKIKDVENRCFSKQKKRMKAIKQNFVIEHEMGMVSCGHVIGTI